MQNANYPNIYEAKFQTGYHGNEPTKNGVYITKCLIRAITKNVRPRYDTTKKAFYSAGNYRIRIEVTESSGCQYYALDVGQGLESTSAEDFMAECRQTGSVSPDVAYCDNMPGIIADTEESGVEQKTGVIKVYATKEDGCGIDTGKRIAGNIALAYIKAINELNDHFVITDTDAFRLL